MLSMPRWLQPAERIELSAGSCGRPKVGCTPSATRNQMRVAENWPEWVLQKIYSDDKIEGQAGTNQNLKTGE